MKLEASLKHFSPQGMHISDIMTGIGVTTSRARFGLAAFFGKTGISKSDEQMAVQALARYAIDSAPKNVRKAAGKSLGRCCLILAQFAFAEYSRSAETTGICTTCEGAGLTKSVEEVVKHPGIYKSDGEEIVAPIIRQEIVLRQCVVCGGKGAINARCRCGGSGQVLDRKETKEHGAPVYKTCERCSGNGFTSVKSANAHRAIQMYIPDLHQSSWSRNWKPFYEGLVDMLHKGERQAAAEFEKATSY